MLKWIRLLILISSVFFLFFQEYTAVYVSVVQATAHGWSQTKAESMFYLCLFWVLVDSINTTTENKNTINWFLWICGVNILDLFCIIMPHGVFLVLLNSTKPEI